LLTCIGNPGFVVPDFIANAGGVICAAMEYCGATQATAFAAIGEQTRANTVAVVEAVTAKRILPRDAALELAAGRVRQGHELPSLLDLVSSFPRPRGLASSPLTPRRQVESVMRRQALFAGLALVILVLPAVAADRPEAEQARTVANQVLGETKSVLESALEGGQPAAALRVCASVAQNIARRHEREGWRVRRVSEKVRNPADTPSVDELAVLRAWQNDKDAGYLTPATEHQEIVTEDGRRYLHYMRPILIAGPVCLQCHGAPDKLAPGVADALKDLYPHDQATGYAVGDLRGAISVKIPIESRP
jgi:hypothetical protein